MSSDDLDMVQLSITSTNGTTRRDSGDTATGEKHVGIRRNRRHPKFSLEENPSAWAKWAGIMCRVCTKFIPKQPSSMTEDLVCNCGYLKSEHTESSLSATRRETDVWVQSKHTAPVPTDAVGEMEFVGFSQKSAKYIRVDNETRTDLVWDFMTRVWKLKPPHLVISVTGGAKIFHLTPRLKEVFRKGLIKAALSTDAWITTGGTYTGVMRYVGEAFRDLAAGQSTQSKVVALGIATWGCITNKPSLVKQKEVARYRIGPPPRKEEAPIDCNHSHVILVDNGTQHKFGVEIDFRAKLEKTIVEKSRGKGVDSSIVLVVVEGGPGTLKTVYSSVLNQTPALIIGGSGRAANILAHAIDKSVEHSLHYNDREGNARQKTVRVLPEETEKTVKQMLATTFKESRQERVVQYVDWIKQCLQFPDLLSVFMLDSNNSAKDIDQAILKALLKANHEYVIEQLRLSLIWNRVDVAKTEIFTDERSWKPGSLNEVLFSAIHLDRMDFVKLFLQGGVSLGDFLTEDILLKLYNNMPRRSLLHLLLRKMKGEEKTEFTLADIGLLIKSLMGDYYSPVYLKEASSKLPTSSQHTEDTGLRKREHPERDLFIWSILMGRCGMAQVFWEESKGSLAASLVAHSLLRSLHKRTTDMELKKKLQQNALYFQQIGVGVLNSCYEDNEEKTCRLLIRHLTMWGNTNCISIAIASNNKQFIAQSACQDLFTEIWWGDLDPSTGYMINLPVFCPLLIFSLVRFKSLEDDTNLESSQNANDRTFEEPLTPSATDDYVGTVTQRRGVKCLRKIKAFYIAPATKFSYNMLFFLLLLLLHSYVMLIEFREGIQIPEMVLTFWIFTIFVEEFRQLWTASPGPPFTRVRHYFSDNWNILDATTIVVFFLGFTLRFFPSTFEAARSILAINLFGFFVRLLHIFSVSKLMGPKLVMIGKMMWDLVSFMIIMLVFIVAFGITSQSILYPNTELHPMLVADVLRKAYWQIFAELFLEEIEGKEDCTEGLVRYTNGTEMRCPSETGRVLVPLLLALYMLLTNVLLLNLLIAMFSNTFQKVQDNTDLHWRFQTYKLTQEYYDRPFLPPPFIILVHLYRLVSFCCRCNSQVTYGFLSKNKQVDPTETRSLDIFEENRRDEYMLGRNIQHMATTDHKVGVASDRIETMVTKIDDIQIHLSSNELKRGSTQTSLSDKPRSQLSGDSLSDRVSCLETEVKKANEALEWLISAMKNNMASHISEISSPPSPKTNDVSSTKPAKKFKGKRLLERQITVDKNRFVHMNARSSPYPGSDVERFEIPEDRVPWEVDFPGYQPPSYTADQILQTPTWADVDPLSKPYVWNQYDEVAKIDRTSYQSTYKVQDGCPLNPSGRTGLQGRGLMGRWGPNHAVDPVVTRWKRDEMGRIVLDDELPVLEFIAIRRHDNKHWSLPGGLVLPNESFVNSVRRRFLAEALSDLVDNQERAREMEPKLQALLDQGEEVYTGYVDDARNTDNAWIETKAVNYHDEEGTITADFALRAGKSEDAAAWLKVWSKMPLHANHLFILEKVANLRGSYF